MIVDGALNRIETEIRDGRAQYSLEANRPEGLSVAAGPRPAGNPREANKKVFSWADELDEEEETQIGQSGRFPVRSISS